MAPGAAAAPSFHSSLKAASEAAAPDQSLVLLVFSAEWCAPCRALKQNTLNSPEFKRDGGAVRVAEVDVDADAATARQFSISAIPALVLLTGDGKIVARREGVLDAGELLRWLAEARERVAQGLWEGTAPSAQIEGLIAKAARDRLGVEDIRQLVALLGNPEPAERAAVGKLIVAQHEQAVPPLIDALGDNYLGLRIAAAELLRKMTRDLPHVDPWLAPDELADTLAALRQWWKETGRLSPPDIAAPLNTSTDSAMKVALDALRRDDPVRRTEAMSALVRHGEPALPAIRAAIRQSEKNGDHRTIALLEDIRWAILIPDSADKRAGGVRNTLARGAGPERQSAAARLARAGRDALPALTELVNDPDSLVVESAVRALSGIGGKDAIPAMAALLKASDSNLRMTAAQALGKARNAEATPHLMTVFNDPNEVVACTALAAVEQTHSRGDSRSKERVPPELTPALKQTLSDPRWRVRAAAAEVAGKLGIHDLVDDLKALLADADGFVVKNTLVALDRLGDAPEPGDLLELSRRLPSLRGDAIAMMLASESEETVEIITGLYNTSGVDEQILILATLAQNESFESDKPDDAWQPLLADAASASDPRLRRASASVIAVRPSKSVAETVTRLLSDEDPETRLGAAEAALKILIADTGRPSRRDEYSFSFSTQTKDTAKKNSLKPEQIAAWRSALLKAGDAASHVRFAALLYLTGDGKSDSATLAEGLKDFKPDAARRLLPSDAIEMIVAKLSWPEGQIVLDQLCASPALFVTAVTESQRAAPEVKQYLFAPDRFHASIETITGDELRGTLSALLGSGRDWSLLSGDDHAAQIIPLLRGSTNGALRAAALYVLGRGAAEQHVAEFEKALGDPEPWVRAAAVQGLAGAIKDRSALEEKLGPLLDDHAAPVREKAAQALLEPEVRAAAGLRWTFDRFKFGGVQAGRSSSSSAGEERPLTVLTHKPTFLETARLRLGGSDDDVPALALLLAQFGDPAGVEHLVAAHSFAPLAEDFELSGPVVAAIALSGDAKHVAMLRKLSEGMENEGDLRTILRALRGMSGPDARELRLEVNRRMRQAGE